jgi:hypothetical protein
MNRLKYEWRTFIKEYGWKMLLDSFFGGLVFATIVFIPVFVILGELISVFMHLKYFLFVLVTLGVMAYFWIINRLTLQALQMKKKEHVSHPEYLIHIHALVWMGIALVAGVIFIVLLIPILWV